MKRNRWILAAAILASGTFASFFGGNLSYALFYSTLIIPVVSFFYTFLVYIRFKLYQKIEQRKVMKGELLPYEFTISNEDIFSYTNIKVNFFADKSYVADAQAETEYLLLPGESNTLKTVLCCKYRGEYDVGVKSVVITDYLYLFSITYPIYTKLNLTVLPRVYPIERLRISQEEPDPRKTRSSAGANREQLDMDVRRYTSADSKRLIHWKASAKSGELLVRKYSENPKTRVLLIMDLSPVREPDLSRVILEDKIIESALSIADYYKSNRTELAVCYDKNGIQKQTIQNDTDFKIFYNHCSGLYFNARAGTGEILQSWMSGSSESVFGILITHSLTAELYETASRALSRGYDITILFISDDTSQPVKQLTEDFHALGIPVFKIMSEDTVTDILSR